MPDELKTTLIEAYWRGLSWQDTTWLGRPDRRRADRSVRVPGADRRRVRPDWIIETGTDGGGRALFLASICELLGHGQVISVERRRRRPCPSTRASPTSTSRRTRSAARARVARAHRRRSARARDPRLAMSATRRMRPWSSTVLAPLVPVGLVRRRREHDRERPSGLAGLRRRAGRGGAARSSRSTATFVQDTTWEKHGLTFHPGGFLRRIPSPPQRPGPVTEPDARRFFFVHLQKTAGTALWRRLQHAVRRRRRVYPGPDDGSHPTRCSRSTHLLERWRVRRRRDPDRHRALPAVHGRAARRAVHDAHVLRDPVERTLSYLRHHRETTPADARPLARGDLRRTRSASSCCTTTW